MVQLPPASGLSRPSHMTLSLIQHRLCSIQYCTRPYYCRGLCALHYERTRSEHKREYRKKRFQNPVYYWARLFHHRLYYRIPGIYERHLERSRRADVRAKHREQNRRCRCRPMTKIRLRANAAVRHALRNGILTRRPCEVCNKTSHIHAHHDSYISEDWLKVRWLCSKHHGEWHRVNEPIYPQLNVH